MAPRSGTAKLTAAARSFCPPPPPRMPHLRERCSSSAASGSCQRCPLRYRQSSGKSVGAAQACRSARHTLPRRRRSYWGTSAAMACSRPSGRESRLRLRVWGPIGTAGPQPRGWLSRELMAGVGGGWTEGGGAVARERGEDGSKVRDGERRRRRRHAPQRSAPSAHSPASRAQPILAASSSICLAISTCACQLCLHAMPPSMLGNGQRPCGAAAAACGRHLQQTCVLTVLRVGEMRGHAGGAVHLERKGRTGRDRLPLVPSSSLLGNGQRSGARLPRHCKASPALGVRQKQGAHWRRIIRNKEGLRGLGEGPAGHGDCRARHR